MKKYVSRKGRETHFRRRIDFLRWNDYPYGKWTCADGREVLFNRWYEPIWQRLPGAVWAREADPQEWVPWEKQEWFYDDGVRPERLKRKRAAIALSEWELPEPG
jgi:hypothetical protein